MRQDVSESIVVTRLELLRRASTHGDLEAWAAFQQSLEGTVITWLHSHPSFEAACRVQSERHFVTLTFERLRQATVQGQVNCKTLSEVSVFLRASLNGAILETLRVSKRLELVSSPWPDEEDRPDKSAVWDRLHSLLSKERERRLAYLLYQCGLEPVEIVRGLLQEWSDVYEVTRLRRSILARCMQRPNCKTP
jgi:hypothetical protein